MKHYLALDFKTGTLYDYSKESQSGYEKHTNSAGKVSYRKYFRKGVYGTLLSAYIKDTERGLQLRIVLVQDPAEGAPSDDKGFYAMIQLNIFDSRGNIDRYVESLIAVLPSLEIGQNYRFFPYTLERKLDSGKTIDQRGISVKTATIDNQGGGEVIEDVIRAFTYQKRGEALEEGQVPALEFKQGLGGKMAPTALSVATRNEFLQDILQREAARLSGEDKEQGEAQPESQEEEAPTTKPQKTSSKRPIQSQPTPNSKATTKAAVGAQGDDEDDDDVPF